VKRGGPKNIVASVQARLVERSRELGVEHQLTLARFGGERLLYRLSTSEFADRFILKGAALLLLWLGEPIRPTKDVDLLGVGDTSAEALKGVFVQLCAIESPDDGLTFLPDSVHVEAGLRCGEMMALEWTDVDFRKRQLTIQRSDWKGHVTSPKSGRLRHVPMTIRLEAALREQRHLKGRRVLCSDDGTPLTQREVQGLVRRAARRANLNVGVHILRHTFCSHLAACGAPARAIQELAGHSEIVTTQRYMHLSPATVNSAIRLLDQRGNMLATTATTAENVSV
jgi:integrase-like protein/nucleotidyltransferase AbiEii toxin of type IV toxin-antitoxin system